MYTVYNDIALISDNWKEEGRGEGKKKKRKKRALEIWKLLPPRRALSRYTEYPEASRYYYLRTLSYSIILGLMEDSVRDKPSVWKKAIIKKKKRGKKKAKEKEKERRKEKESREEHEESASSPLFPRGWTRRPFEWQTFEESRPEEEIFQTTLRVLWSR